MLLLLLVTVAEHRQMVSVSVIIIISSVARKRLRSLYSSMWSATVLLIIAVGPTYFWPKLLCRTIP